ncbi:MAG TPA: SDR family NAD(P)-dependent oxidoreductase [Candidatus Binataceae bacterium]|nr:SDR family NAD(P)-dependent oxidoreductase [Candidatus Binataceae bacterium]
MKSVIITGGNSGLGFECARALVETREWYVIVACRDPERGREAIKRLYARSWYKPMEAMVLDLGSMASIRTFAANYAARGDLPPLGALVCNAGTQVVAKRTQTADGFETTFGVNHLGHFLLANLMLRQMEPQARIIFVSSGTHDPSQTTGMPAPRLLTARELAYPERNAETMRESPGQFGRRAYTTSKLCNVMCTYEMSRRLRLEESNLQGITVNAFDPGLMPATGLARDYSGFMRFAWNYVLPVLRPFVPHVNSVRHSGKALASLVTDPKLERTTAKYFQGYKEEPSSTESYERDRAAALWQQSAELVHLTREETPLPLPSDSRASAA